MPPFMQVWERIEDAVFDAGLDGDQIEDLSLDVEAWLDAAAIDADHADTARTRLVGLVADLGLPDRIRDTLLTVIGDVSPARAPESPVTEPVATTGMGEDERDLPEPVDFPPDTAIVVPESAKDRAHANLAAIRLLDVLDRENRYATPDEQAVLARWSGWGAVPQVFERGPEWEAEHTELSELLDPAQWALARESMLNAHYTDPRIAAVMWRAVQRAGFTGGRVLEPGCGSGTFIAHAPAEAVMVGVEVDPVSARIAAALYPTRAQIRAEGFEETRVETDSFTAAIGNVPFAKLRLYDPAHNPTNQLIHNHFLIKSLDLVGPGGYVAVITSMYTAENLDDRARREMADRADLIGGLRLPAKAFQRVAGTDTSTDLLVWRVREPEREPSHDTRLFLGQGTLTVREKTEHGHYEVREFQINRYFAEHPEHILGTLTYASNAFGREDLYVDGVAGDALAERIDAHLTRLIDQARDNDLGLIATAESTALVGADVETGLVVPTTETGGVAVDTLRWNDDQQRIDVYGPAGWTRAEVRGKRKMAEWRALLGLRDVATQLVGAQLDGRDAQQRAALRSELNRRYDTYLAKYGYINRFTMIDPPAVDDARHRAQLDTAIERWRIEQGTAERPFQGAVPDEVLEELSDKAWESEREPYKKQAHLEGILRNDPTTSVVFALEHFDEQTHRGTKAAIFTSDVIHAAPTPPTHADTIQDAIAISLDESNRIDLPRITGLLDTTREDVETQLEATGLAFRSLDDPDTWLHAPMYLSGNVRRKLAAATEAAGRDPRYRANAAALAAVVPERKTTVDVRLGAVWVESADYVQFIRDTFTIPAEEKVLVERVDGQWVIQVDKTYPGARGDLLKWGLAPKAFQGQREGGYNFEDPKADELGIAYAGVAGGDYDHITLLGDLCNSAPIRVNKSKDYLTTVGGDQLHARATRAVQSKARRLAQEFENWAMDSDPARRERLLDRYNELFNSVVAPAYSGAHLTVPGLGTHYKPYRYQLDAVARIVSEPATLLDHVVGAGKTGTMLMAAMELRRLHLARQPWIVVPNHIVDQVAREANQWYPGARVLCGSSATDPAGRRRLIAQSAAQDWDFVIVPASAFKRMPTSKQTRTAFIQSKIDELGIAQGELEGKKASKILEVRLKAAKQQLKKQLEEIKRDTGIGFEDSGCDYLFIDEAHHYKNLLRVSNITELACTPGSQQAMDLQLKLEYLRKKRRREAVAAGIPADAYVERVATFATGTPVSNSIGELWVMTNYLRPDLLEEAGVRHLDSWGAVFTTTRDTIELNTSGSRFETRTRVGDFVNTGDLIGMTSVFTDSVTRDQITAALPELDEGQRIVVSFTPSQEVADFIADLGYRADTTDPKRLDIDNGLKIATDGRNVTLDPRAAHLDPPGAIEKRLDYLRELARRSGHEDIAEDQQFLAAMAAGSEASAVADEADQGRLRASVVAEQILAVHADTRDNTYTDDLGEPSPVTGGLQIVFCDRATPKTDRAQWTIYQAIKDELVAGGMEPDGIRFIHDYRNAAAKANLFADCRAGKVSVLFGSTEKMGTGANIQTRAVALHHVDVPWRPADLEQREGRIIRQHNQNPSVRIFCYIAERTFDTYMWQVLERKAFFIERLKRADRSARRVQDLGADSLAENAAMIKAIATGDDRYIRQIELQSAVADLQAEQDAYFSAARSAEREHQTLQAAIPGHRRAIAALESALADAEKHHQDGTTPPTTVHGTTYTERTDASRALVETLRQAAGRLHNRPVDEAITVATIAGLDIEVRYSTSNSELYLKPVGLAVTPRAIEHEKLYLDPKKQQGLTAEERDKAFGQLASGLMTRVENLVNDLPKALEERRWRLHLDTDRLQQLDTEPPTGFDRLGELKAMYDELDQLERQLRHEATSPEAIARREALEQRLAAKGRHRGWSLMLNATPALCHQLGLDSPAQVRALMAQHADEACLEKIEQYKAERPNGRPPVDRDRNGRSVSEGAVVVALVAKSQCHEVIGPVQHPVHDATVIPFRTQNRGTELDS
ncbi:DEAD/DEAH box helicase family protein [Nocardia terpenica]|uniref:Helicase ATP-binding domain-containing protein n=2 Tax=Nocardia terpenica TaxID=455432 RepID=A0A164KQQ2_9NOCA|nr:DEAD/DEAH box helicase family protein [Nocardia terpenica]KZM71635.1 hypothetical protein AWN90_02610 [Nocardia terpenica]